MVPVSFSLRFCLSALFSSLLFAYTIILFFLSIHLCSFYHSTSINYLPSILTSTVYNISCPYHHTYLYLNPSNTHRIPSTLLYTPYYAYLCIYLSALNTQGVSYPSPFPATVSSPCLRTSFSSSGECCSRGRE